MKYSAMTVAVFPVICNYSSEEDIETSSKNDKIVRNVSMSFPISVDYIYKVTPLDPPQTTRTRYNL